MDGRDSEALLGLFVDGGYSVTENYEEVNVILINMCSVRNDAENRTLSFAEGLKNVTRLPVALRGTHYTLRIYEICSKDYGRDYV